MATSAIEDPAFVRRNPVIVFTANELFSWHGPRAALTALGPPFLDLSASMLRTESLSRSQMQRSSFISVCRRFTSGSLSLARR
jgi:hypothetical protein